MIRNRSLALLAGLLAAFQASAADGTAIGTSNGIAGPADAVFRQGMWWSPERSGSGWDINRVGDRVYVVWYTYAEDGRPTWYASSGVLDGRRFQAELLSHSWSDNGPGPVTVVGSLDIEFPGTQVADVAWQIDGHEGRRILAPFIFATDPVLEDHSGIWYDPSDSGYGITVQNQGEATFAVLYYYDAEGRPTWGSGAGDLDAQDIPLLRSEGTCPWCDYRRPQSTESGHAQLEFETETRMRVTLQFEGSTGWDRDDVGHVMLSKPPSGRSHPAAMAALSSPDALRFYFRNAMRNDGYYSLPFNCHWPPIVSPAPPGAIPAGQGLSETNVQEAGVDEADVVKATWDDLFAIDHAADQPPFVDTGTEEYQEGYFEQTISRYHVTLGDGNPTLVGQYTAVLPALRSRYVRVVGEGLYHHAGADGSSRLLYLGSQVESRCYGNANGGGAHLLAWSTAENDDFEAEQTLGLDGEIVTSRVIGDRLYLMIVYQPDFHLIAERALAPEDRKETYTSEDVESLFDQVPSDLLLPQIRYTDGESRPLVAATDILVPPLPASRLAARLTVLAAFDLTDLEAPPVSMGVMGQMEGLYASTSAAWLAGLQPVHRIEGDGRVFQTPDVDTELHRFEINETGFEYTGSGVIEGYLGSDPRRLAFRMSEHDGVLRVLSQAGWNVSERWSPHGQHRLYTLDTQPDANGRLNPLAVLPNAQYPEPIGKPGEQLYGVRYFGNRGYAVTFERVDPLYAFDLSDPLEPTILGELEIPGFSDYLHPVDENLLLGVGMNATTIVQNNGSEVTLNQGVQVGLFDVSDAGAPKLLDQEEIGWRGSSTPVTDTHHAFTWLPADPLIGRPARFALPVSMHGPGNQPPVNDPWHHYPWQATSALMYEIAGGAGTPWLRRVGEPPIALPGSIPDNYEHLFDYLPADGARSVIQGNRLLFWLRGGLFSAPWGGSEFTPADGCALCTPWNIP